MVMNFTGKNIYISALFLDDFNLEKLNYCFSTAELHSVFVTSLSFPQMVFQEFKHEITSN